VLVASPTAAGEAPPSSVDWSDRRCMIPRRRGAGRRAERIAVTAVMLLRVAFPWRRCWR